MVGPKRLSYRGRERLKRCTKWRVKCTEDFEP